MAEKEHPINDGWADLASIDKLIHEPARLAAKASRVSTPALSAG
jgi:hypothetical protein